MQYRNLGNSGMKVSVVGLGTNNFGRRMDQQQSAQVVQTALECGINFFDTADVYGGGLSEQYLGAAVQGKRAQVLIATKFRSPMGEGPNDQGASRLYIRRAIEASLQRLGTDYVDLYQIHSPDGGTPLEETLDTLNALVHEGKVRYIGSSNYAGWQIVDADWISKVNHWVPFVSAQNEYSLLDRSVEREVIPACLHAGVGMLPYFPLASGLLTGKYQRNQPGPEGARLTTSPNSSRFMNDRNWEIVEKLERFAQEHGISLLDVAIGGLAAQPAVASVIAGATKPEQVVANAKAGEWVPTPEELGELNTLAPAEHPDAG